VHTHDDLELLSNPTMINKISQGVTTVIIGNCGISASPYRLDKSAPDPINLLGQASEFLFSSLQDYIDHFNQVHPYLNVAALVGHTSLRAQIMGELNRPATTAEISQMVTLFRLALTQGAKGLSTGRAYENAKNASTQEVTALVNQLADFEGIYSTHLRTEFDAIVDALDEAFLVAKEAKIPIVISHVKCAGKDNWGRADEIIKHIEDRQKGQKSAVTATPIMLVLAP
jgi:N-acyl-D-amino-acid deacylase